MPFPFYVLANGQDPLTLDASNFYYFLAQGGVYQVRRTPYYASITKATAPSLENFPKVEIELDLRIPNVPARLLSLAGSFFRWAYVRKQAEAIVLLYLNQDTGEWTMDAPTQWVPTDKFGRSWMALEYDPSSLERPKGSLLYGTIHSHCNGGAFHSSTDEHDEKYGDGLHVTFGHIMSKVPDLAASFVSNTTRFKYEPWEVLERFEIVQDTHPVTWQDRHRRRVKKWDKKDDGWSWGGHL